MNSSYTDPASVTHRLRFFPELTRPLRELDRVGAFGSLYLAEAV